MHDRHFFHRNYLVSVSVELLHICADDIKLRLHRKKGHLLQAAVRERYIVTVHFHDIIAFTRLYALVVSLSNAHVLVYLNDMENMLELVLKRLHDDIKLTGELAVAHKHEVRGRI